ncbi:hypothetical protein E8E14_003306 [Neopestalotiopsis sp. 37M]|nr:hypothetical protein E8E14_003306 [Neopestalotiopsis sp. 37M]
MASAVLHLQPTAESQRQWFDVVNNSPGVPRSVIVDTYPDPYYTSNRQTNWGIDGVDYCHKLGPDFYHALAALHRLPNVSEVALRFTSDCFGTQTASRSPTTDAGWVFEDRERRATILDAFFKATAEHCRTTGNQALQSLTVRNLQNTTCEGVTTSDDFRETVKHLTALHLQVCTEWNDDHAYLLEEMSTFWPHLRSRWLEPLADQLDTLSLYWDTRWGLFPAMDMRGLHFPKLRSLLLGTYVFGLDEQLRWLLSHKTLRYLSLDACVICSDWRVSDPTEYYFQDELRMAKANFPVAVPFDPKVAGTGLGSDWRFKYDLRWPAVFEQLANELPELRDFRFADNWDPFGEGSQKELRGDTRFEDRYSLGAEYGSPSPYVIFFPGMGGDGFDVRWVSDAYDHDQSMDDTLREKQIVAEQIETA